MDGFGTIAFGVRSSQPDPRFMQCWTKLTLGASRTGDKILTPAIEMPHHWAATCLVRDFLDGTDCDMLLLVDDDMTFEPADLVQLRDNPANHDFGIVQALCCSRQPPHRPLVLLEAGTKYKPLENPREGSGTIEVGMVGLAFTLIRREVLLAVADTLDPDVLMFNWGMDGRGEDGTFCRTVRELGYLIGVDTTVSIGHRIKMEVKWDTKLCKAVYESYDNPTFLRLLFQREDKQKGG